MSSHRCSRPCLTTCNCADCNRSAPQQITCWQPQLWLSLFLQCYSEYSNHWHFCIVFIASLVLCKGKQLSMMGVTVCASAAGNRLGGCWQPAEQWVVFHGRGDMGHAPQWSIPAAWEICILCRPNICAFLSKIQFLQGSLWSIDVTVTRQQGDLWSVMCEHGTRCATDGKELIRNSVLIKAQSAAMFTMFPLWSSVLFLSSNCLRLPADAFWNRRYKVSMWLQILRSSSGLVGISEDGFTTSKHLNSILKLN